MTGSVVRLRPIVHASPLANGVHVRGWSSSFTVDGGADLWKLWQVLARRLADGVSADRLVPAARRPEVARAAELIVAQLRGHDMLVEVPVAWGEPDAVGAPDPDLAGWLESVAAHPATAWDRLRGTRVSLRGRGAVLEAAHRTLRAAGVTALTGGAADPDVTLFGVIDGVGGLAVAARCVGEVGFVVPTGGADAVCGVATAVARRLGLPDADDPAAVEPPYPLAALVGAAAAHRLVCAAAGLPDPARQAATLAAAGTAAVWEAGGTGPGPDPVDDHPAVLVARLDPLSATYHPWLPAAGPSTQDSTGDAVGAALHGLTALTDPELGVLPRPRLGDLPQLPACLAVTGDAPGDALGVGVTADAARLAAALAAAERALDRPGPQAGTNGGAGSNGGAGANGAGSDGAGAGTRANGGAGANGVGSVRPRVSVGADRRHAVGVALRRRCRASLSTVDTVPDSAWDTSPTARRWWKTLTLRLGVPARVDVHRLAADAVCARVGADGAELAWAIEASPPDAVAFAVLAAVGSVQARRAGVPVADGSVLLTGAAPAWRPEHADAAPWTDAAWYWPADVTDSEDALQQTMLRLVPGPVRDLPADSDLVRALAAVGFHAVVA